MKKIIKKIGIIAVMLCVGVQTIQAQIEDIYYPHPDYLNWYCPRLSDYGGFSGIVIDNIVDSFDDTTTKYFILQPYNFASPSRVDSCRIYGLAACLIGRLRDDAHVPADAPCLSYYNGFPVDVTLDAVIYEGTEGDSVLHLVKKQTVVINKGQYPDKGIHFSDTGGVRTGVYEFYFDKPVTVKGTFFLGLRNKVYYLEGDDSNPFGYGVEGVCYHGAWRYGAPGYMEIYVVPDTLNAEQVFVDKFNYHGVIPDVEAQGLKTVVLPCYYPIIRSRNGSVDEAGEAEDGVEVSPNPSRGRTEVHSVRAIRSVEVCDMSGRVVIRKRMGGGQHSVELTERLPQGCYVVRVETEQGTAVKKLVVE